LFCFLLVTKVQFLLQPCKFFAKKAGQLHQNSVVTLPENNFLESDIKV